MYWCKNNINVVVCNICDIRFGTFIKITKFEYSPMLPTNLKVLRCSASKPCMFEVVYCHHYPFQYTLDTSARCSRPMYYLVWKLRELLSELRLTRFVHCLEF